MHYVQPRNLYYQRSPTSPALIRMEQPNGERPRGSISQHLFVYNGEKTATPLEDLDQYEVYGSLKVCFLISAASRKENVQLWCFLSNNTYYHTWHRVM